MTRSKKLLIAAGTLLGLCAVGFVGARVAVVAASPMPGNLGVSNGQLAPCPNSPNCVSSYATNAEHGIEPLTYSGDAEAAHARLVQVLESMPRLTIVENRPDYLRAETQSPTMGFIDDNEFYFNENEGIIQVRAAARLGHSDMGKNRERIEQIRAAFNAAQ